ncbi:RNA-directed DNA polymerase, eukaryota, reverse transcriptase zinc-binding domain protein [Tanacetum coccineum]
MCSNTAKTNIQNSLSELDKLIDHGRGNEELVHERTNLLKELHDLNSKTSLDLLQKAKIRWAIEGDEKPKYFHGIIDKKRSQLAIRGVLVDGDWVVDPFNVKEEFLNHFYKRFAYPNSPRLVLDSHVPTVLSLDQILDLESDVSYEEIKKAVWDCGINKSSGPGILSPGCNSSFIAFIPKMHEAKVVKDFCPISLIAAFIGSSTFVAPFNFLGVKVGAMMSRRSSWDEVIGKLSSRLSKWKLKTLSIGGRITLIKSILSSLPLYQMSIFKCPMGVLNILESIRQNFFNGVTNSNRRLALIGWNKICASKKNGGLCVSSFFAFNRALLFKWIWCFIYQDSSLWFRVIQAMYGIRGALDRSHSLPARNSPWIDIIREVKRLSLKGIDLLSFVKKKLAMLDKNISIAVKMRDNSLISSFRRVPRGGIEDDQIWNLESSGELSVKSVCSFIDDLLFPKADVHTRWVKAVHIKINIFRWRVSLDKLPTRLNLSLRGVDIPSTLCPLCSIIVESSSHLLFSCHLARSLTHKIARWWDLDIQDFNSYGDWLIWLNNIWLPSKLKEILEGTCYITWFYDTPTKIAEFSGM